MSINKLFAVLLALVLGVAPPFSRAGEALAAVADHHARTMDAGHCHAPEEGQGNPDEAPAKTSCIAMCMAIAIAPSAPLTNSQPKPDPVIFAVPRLHLSYLGEIATPPPRRS